MSKQENISRRSKYHHPSVTFEKVIAQKWYIMQKETCTASLLHLMMTVCRQLKQEMISKLSMPAMLISKNLGCFIILSKYKII